MQIKKLHLFFVAIFLLGLFISAIHPHDYFTWFLEVVPAMVAFVVMVITYKKFVLSDFLYAFILMHCFILFVGGHYTYAEVPWFNELRDFFHQSRNNYDKVGHFVQGFVPALAAREILIRKNVVVRRGWLSFIVVSICLAISACYELAEALAAITGGDSADAFLGTQGYVWDTQSDMFFALIGACSSLFLGKAHDRSMAKLKKVHSR